MDDRRDSSTGTRRGARPDAPGRGRSRARPGLHTEAPRRPDTADRQDPTRRAFLGAAAHGLGGAWLATQLPAIEAAARYAYEAFERGQAFETLTPAEARELEAIAAQIFPSDETPGAREAGVVHFIDRALGTFQSRSLPAVREGLEDLQARAREADPSAPGFSALGPARQIDLLREIEAGGFFALVLTLTIQGMFAHPERGGNRNKVGWEILGFEDRFSWQPPFGHYDAEAADG